MLKEVCDSLNGRSNPSQASSIASAGKSVLSAASAVVLPVPQTICLVAVAKPKMISKSALLGLRDRCALAASDELNGFIRDTFRSLGAGIAAKFEEDARAQVVSRESCARTPVERACGQHNRDAACRRRAPD